MSDFVDLSGGREIEPRKPSALSVSNPKSNVPDYKTLQKQLEEAGKLTGSIVLKNYLTALSGLEIVPMDEDLKKISDIRLFKITEMVYQNNEYSTYKFASVFNSVQNLNCGVFIIVDSNGQKTDFYMGVRSFDDKRTTKSLKDTLKNALIGHFPGVKTQDMLDTEAEEFLGSIKSNNITSVSCVAKNKDEEFNDNERFIQGLEKLALAMQGQRYTAIVLAKGTPPEELAQARQAYETIYTHLSPFASVQVSYGTNTALNVSETLSWGITKGTSHSDSDSKQTGTSHTKGTGTNESTSTPDAKGAILKSIGMTVVSVAGAALAPFTGGASAIAAGMLNGALGAIQPKTNIKGTSTNESDTVSESRTVSRTDTTNESENRNTAQTKGETFGTSDNMQLTVQNKTLIDTLERIDEQLKRINECESLGMWECAAYFLSDTQETAEMAAGTYKALMKGEKSGVETSAINFWGRGETKKLPLLRDYITNFVHPVFEYRSESTAVPVTAASLVSGNELALSMGLPRKSVCGFPVIEHADFGKEAAKYTAGEKSGFALGNIFNMGTESATEVHLDRDSLTMHTFITGSTGSGKSNTVYEILNQLRSVYNVPFLVVEPAKGEYKNVFGNNSDVSVYGTNPALTPILRINPFRFPHNNKDASKNIHILEHLDRLVEIFNVCWPMYAAMPAILKSAVEKSYEEAGWDLQKSENYHNATLYPSFIDIVKNIKRILDSSEYSDENKGNYKGALITRLTSLTNGINGMIFTNDDLSGEELFDRNVIVDLSRVGSAETKALIMGLLVMKLQEFRMTSGRMNSDLQHVTVLEEAHTLLKRTSTAQSDESSNLLGKSVEMLANSIAEMRTYGEGFIIADQSPGLLDMSVIRNTNTKIILRLPDEGDRTLVGKAAGLNDEQIVELAKLQRGVAAVYQNDWIQPVLCKVKKYSATEEAYQPKTEIKTDGMDKLKADLTAYLVSKIIKEPVEGDEEKLKKRLWKSNLSISLKLALNDFFTARKLPESIAPLSGIIAEMYTHDYQVIDSFIKNRTIDFAWAKTLERSIKPAVVDISDKVRQQIMNAIIWETRQQRKELTDEFTEKWKAFIWNRNI